MLYDKELASMSSEHELKTKHEEITIDTLNNFIRKVRDYCPLRTD